MNQGKYISASIKVGIPIAFMVVYLVLIFNPSIITVPLSIIYTLTIIYFGYVLIKAM
jgi:hypothetical protein